MTAQQSRQTEPAANAALGELLRGMLAGCQVRSENTRLIAGQPGLQLDNLVTAPGQAPVVVEAEFLPAYTAEKEAVERLDLPVAGEFHAIEAAIALRYPASLANAADLKTALAGSRLSWCVHYTGGARFPQAGWLEGSAADLADLIRLVAVPQRAVDEAATRLREGIERAAVVLDELHQARPNIAGDIAGLLGMSNVPQTRRMAGAIIANALVFHERIAGMHPGIKALNLVCGPGVANPQNETLAAWSEILKINYWPIFAIGRDILGNLPSDYAGRILQTLQYTVGEVNGLGIDNTHDLTGRIFQRLIADRKYLATFYTLPASAALLARLAVAKMDGVDWSDAGAIGKLRIGDFACGTGALLSAVYEQVSARHQRGGGDPANLHRLMMEEALYGCDVMPSAAHITGSTLAGAQPNIGFGRSRIYTLPYGRQTDGAVKIGSLELLQSSSAIALFNTSDPALRTGSVGQETAANVIADVPDGGFDLVIMNPPFTNATNHEGAHADITNPAFAAFNATATDQKAMGSRLNQLGKTSCYHGNAGMASAFAALADNKLKPGGVLALVLPLSAAAGLSWQGFRQMLATGYTDLSVLSIAANGKDMSFSSDTGMAECLVIARKLKAEEASGHQGHFTSLANRPEGFAPASSLASNINGSGNIRTIEDGPYGGTSLLVGSESSGEMLKSPFPADGTAWGAVRLSDYSLAQTAYALAHSKLWLPGSSSAVELKTTLLNIIGKLGFVHRDITGPAPRGPFDKVAPSPTATYPALWNHDAKNETRMVCEPDSQLQVRQGMEEKAATVWATASRSHLNLDFTFGSQALSVAFTNLASIGGRVWPNVIFGNERFDYAFAIWGNSTLVPFPLEYALYQIPVSPARRSRASWNPQLEVTFQYRQDYLEPVLGLLMHWWHSSRQQSSKAGITIRSAETLPILDFRALSDAQLAKAKEIFDEFRDKELKPACLADADPNRALLDRRVVCGLLGFDEDVYQGVRRLSAKWCSEPSVHGGKKRPSGAALVM